MNTVDRLRDRAAKKKKAVRVRNYDRERAIERICRLAIDKAAPRDIGRLSIITVVV